MTYEKFSSYEEPLGNLMVCALLGAVAVLLLTGYRELWMAWLAIGLVYLLHAVTCLLWASYRFWRRAGRRD